MTCKMYRSTRKWCLEWPQAVIQFSCSVMSDSLRPHGLQHTRPPCLSPTPGIYSNSCPVSQWCRPTTSSSFAPFSFFLQSFAASGCFPMTWLFVPGSQNSRASASASVLSVNIQGWFPLGLTGLISLLQCSTVDSECGCIHIQVGIC